MCFQALCAREVAALQCTWTLELKVVKQSTTRLIGCTLGINLRATHSDNCSQQASKRISIKSLTFAYKSCIAHEDVLAFKVVPRCPRRWSDGIFGSYHLSFDVMGGDVSRSDGKSELGYFTHAQLQSS